MSLGNPQSQRGVFFLSPDAGVRESNAQYFIIDRGILPASGQSIVLDLWIENLGIADTTVKVEVSAYTGDPSFAPFATTYGTDFTSSFSTLATLVVKPGGSLQNAGTILSTQRFVRVFIDPAAASQSPVKFTISPNRVISPLN